MRENEHITSPVKQPQKYLSVLTTGDVFRDSAMHSAFRGRILRHHGGSHGLATHVWCPMYSQSARKTQQTEPRNCAMTKLALFIPCCCRVSHNWSSVNGFDPGCATVHYIREERAAYPRGNRKLIKPSWQRATGGSTRLADARTAFGCKSRDATPRQSTRPKDRQSPQIWVRF